jgi:hypothetical protein
MKLVRCVRAISTEEMERLEREYDDRQEVERAAA